MSLRSQVKVDLTGSYQVETIGGARVTADIGDRWATVLDDGTGVDQADVAYTLSGQEVASGGVLSLDLKGGGLLDALGNPFTPDKLRVVCVVARRTNTTDLTLFGDANSIPVVSLPLATHVLRPGGIFFLLERSATGIQVTAGTGDILRIANAVGAVAKLDLVLIGTSSSSS